MRILLVEDEKRISALMKKGLEMRRHFVDEAFDGKEGLKMAQSKKYDLMMIDLLLPKMAGLELIGRIRKQDATTPILIVSAKDTPRERARGIKAGANDYILKPFIFADLIKRIETFAGEKINDNETQKSNKKKNGFFSAKNKGMGFVKTRKTQPT